MENKIIDLLSYLGALQGYILAIVVLFYPQQYKVSNRILALFLFISAHLLIATRITDSVDSNYIFLIYGIRFFGSISLLLYIKSLYQPVKWKLYGWHLILIGLDFFVILNRISPDPFIFQGVGLEIFTLGWYLILSAFYLILIFRAYQQYKKKVYRNFSSLHNLGIKWVYQIFVGILVLITLDAFFVFVSLGLTDVLTPYHRLVKTIGYTIFMYFIVIKGKLTPQIYQLGLIEESPASAGKTVKEEESKHLKIVAEKVMSLMEKEKIFKEEAISVKEIADKIHLQPYIVSQAINACLGKNFFDLVNGFRVEESKHLMQDDRLSHLSLLGIAFEAGFTSKTAFNTAFKKFTGMTPSQYKKEAVIA